MCRYDEAIADFTEAIRLAPEVPHAYYGRGWVYSKEGAKGKAETDFAEGKKRRANRRRRRGRRWGREGIGMPQSG